MQKQGTVLKSLPISPDGISIVTLDVGALFPFPSEIYDGLRDAGFVADANEALETIVADGPVLDRVLTADRIAVLVASRRLRLSTAAWNALSASEQLQAMQDLEAEMLARLKALDHDGDGVPGGSKPATPAAEAPAEQPQQPQASDEPDAPAADAPDISPSELPAIPQPSDDGDSTMPAGEEPAGAAENDTSEPASTEPSDVEGVIVDEAAPAADPASPPTGDAPVDFDAMSDDELRDFIENRDGKRPSSRAGRDTLLSRARGTEE